MAEKSPDDKIPFTVHLPVDLARRLKLAADTQKRPAADLVVDMLSRHLPRLDSGASKKGKIPYA
jgi:hypothetical protein